MDKDQAFSLVRQACEKFAGTLQDHQAIQTALQVIHNLINPPVEAELVDDEPEMNGKVPTLQAAQQGE